jgi:hypothetical protein
MHLLLHFLEIISETFSIILSHKNDSLFIFMITHYYVETRKCYEK